MILLRAGTSTTKPDPNADYADKEDGEGYEFLDAYDEDEYSDGGSFEDDEPV
ncbi:MAG: hypothetical protein LUG45_02795 [Clostridiales bacterium]|nr:hypothetical protein [Clostridiales bacterium]